MAQFRERERLNLGFMSQMGSSESSVAASVCLDRGYFVAELIQPAASYSVITLVGDSSCGDGKGFSLPRNCSEDMGIASLQGSRTSLTFLDV